MMKRILALTFALVFILALFSGCGASGGDNTAKNDSTTQKQDTAVNTQTSAPSSEVKSPSPYNFAEGNFEKDADGIATKPYNYTLPLSTTDETLDFWTVIWTPQYITEDGYGKMPYAEGYKNLTGVNIEYIICAAESKAENFGVMLASDSLPDMMSQGNYYYPGTYQQSIEDGFFANIHDYLDYCPNYAYQSVYACPTDKVSKETVFFDKKTIVAFYAMYDKAQIDGSNMVRGDWLEKFGMTNKDLVTWDDYENYLTMVKSQISTCEFPMILYYDIDTSGHGAYCHSPCFDTLVASSSIMSICPLYVVNGKVRFGGTTDNDKNYLMKLNDLFAKKLIDPNWTHYTTNTSLGDKITTDKIGWLWLSAGEVKDYNSKDNDPKCSWVPAHKPLLKEGQVLHLGGDVTRVTYGCTNISAKCENIKLAVTWMDWRYSEDGAFYATWGPEGVMWNYSDDGKVMATEWALNNPDGLAYSFLYMLYGLNMLADGGMCLTGRTYAYKGGEKVAAIYEFWNDYAYDGTYEFPVGARLSPDEDKVKDQVAGDFMTYILESLPGFIDGSTPFSEWKAYQDMLEKLNKEKLLGLYQDAYDRYITG